MMIVCLLFGCAAMATADQTDPRLDSLFAQLHGDPGRAEAEQLTGEIWRIWRQTGDLEAARLMSDGLRAMQNEHYHAALSVFDRLVESRPDFAEAWNRRATLYFLIGEFDHSVADIRRVLELEPRHFGALSGLGLIYMQLGEDEAAIRAFEQALDINPHLAGARANIEHIRRDRRDRTI